MGEFDELNSSIGVVLSFSEKTSNNFNKTLKNIQNKLFNIGAEVLTCNNLSKFDKKNYKKRNYLFRRKIIVF